MHIFKPTIYLLFTAVFLSFSYPAPSQNGTETCGTVITSETLNSYKKIGPQLKKYEQSFNKMTSLGKKSQVKTINAIPIKAHIIRQLNGVGGLCISDLNSAISTLNNLYADAFMEFFLCDGINYIDESALFHLKKGNEKNLMENNNVSGVINIYFTDYIETNPDESICGYANNEGRNDLIVMKNSCVTNGTSLAHEMGHFFSLLHTHGPDDAMTTEWVDGSNCDTDGDGICDTPADPKLTAKNVNNFCEYTGTATDAHGDTYKPDTGNIMSYAMKGCRSHFSQQQLARMYAFYQTAKSYLACPTFNANFTVDVNQTCESELTVHFQSSCKNITKWEWDIDSDGIIDYTTQNPTHTFKSGMYDVSLTVSNKTKSLKKTYSKLIKVGYAMSLFDEDFDTVETQNDLNWTTKDVTENGYNWLLNAGKTPSDGTGPTLKNNAKNYMYAEATGAKPGDVAELLSPCITIENPNSEIAFSYHMFGNHVGALHIDLKTDAGYINDIIPALIGGQQKNQEDAFLETSIDVSDYAFQTINLRFRAVRGLDWDGDIAIDNVLLKTIDVPISDAAVKVFPNPISGDILYLSGMASTENRTYEISNLAGKVLKYGMLTSRQINVAPLTSGMYILTINSPNSKVTKKIIR